MAKINVGSLDTRSAGRKLNIPVQTPLPGKTQVLNNTGGFVWEASIWDQLERFLILGAEGGTYYVGEADVLKTSHKALTECLAADPRRAVKLITDISLKGRAYKNEPALFALAVAASSKNAETSAMALHAVPQVCRIGTHLYHFASYVTAMRGLGRGLKTALGRWFTQGTAENVAYQAVKYQQRDGWSARDVLRVAHPKAPTQAHEAVFRWIVGGIEATGRREVAGRKHGVKTDTRVYPDVREHLPAIVEAHEEAKTASVKTLVKLITEHGLVRESIPTDKLGSVEVWDALLQHMPMTAMIRNLGKMTSIGLLKPMSDASKLVSARLKDV